MHIKETVYHKTHINWIVIMIMLISDFTIFILFKRGFGTNPITMSGFLTLTALFIFFTILSICSIYIDNDHLIVKNGLGLLLRKKIRIMSILSIEIIERKSRFSPKAANLKDWWSIYVATFEKRGLLIRCNNGFGLLIGFNDIDCIKEEIEKRLPHNAGKS